MGKVGVTMVVKYKNNWIPTKTLEEMSKTNYDVLIVGSGPGGGATLQRLCELWKNQGAKKIGILEMGDKLFHSHAQNIPTQNVNTSRDNLLPNNSTPIRQAFTAIFRSNDGLCTWGKVFVLECSNSKADSF